VEFCDGTNWTSPSSCVAPSDCSAIGDVCADGSLFAGFVADNDGTCRAIHVTNANQSTGIQWKNSSGTNDISIDDHFDGRVNAANRAGLITNFPAFDLCESNTYHSKSDWYLPSSTELRLLWLNSPAIDANAAGSFGTNSFWSSTESGSFNAHYESMPGGQTQTGGKAGNNSVRCIR
jgi:hypothetical protein